MRLAVDATAVAPGAKGIGRVAKGTAEALAADGVDVTALVQADVALTCFRWARPDASKRSGMPRAPRDVIE